MAGNAVGPLFSANLGYFQCHRWLLLLSLLGVALGVAVVAGVEVTNHSVRNNFKLASEQLLGRASHQISADQPFSEGLLTRLRTELGVTAAPLIRRYVHLHEPQGPVFRLLGIDPLQLAQFRPEAALQSSASFRLQDLIQTTNGVLVGAISSRRLGLSDAPFQVITATGVETLRPLGRIGDPDDSRFSRLLLIDIGHAQQLLGSQGLLDAIELQLAGDQVDRVRRWLPSGYRLESHSGLLAGRDNLADALQLNLSAMGLLAMVVGLFLVYNTLHFSLLQRQPLFAQLRALGVTQPELLVYLLAELLLLGLLGSLLGLSLGTLLAEQLLGLVNRTVNDLYATSPIQLLHLDLAIFLRVLLVGMAGALLVGWGAGWRILRQSVNRGQRRQSLEADARSRSRRLCGYALVLLLVAAPFGLVSATGPVGGYIAVTALLLACACMMPALLLGGCAVAEALLGGLARDAGLLWRMAIGDCRRGLSRTAVALMALMVAVSATVGMATMIGSFRTTVELWLGQRLNADIYLSVDTRVPEDQQTLPARLGPWLAEQPEVRALASYYRTRVWSDGRPITLFVNQMPAPTRAGYRFKGDSLDNVWKRFDQSDQLLVSEPLATHWKLAVGDVVPLQTPDGVKAFQVAGVYYDYGSDTGRAIISRENYRRYWPAESARVLGLYLQPETDSGALIDRTDRYQQQLHPEQTLDIAQSRGVLARSMAVFERTFRVTDVLRLLAVAVAFVGVLGALLALQLERRGEMRLYRALGFTLWQRQRLLLYQSLLIGLFSGLAAIPVGLLLAWGLTDIIQLRAFGWTLLFEPQPAMLIQAPLLSLSAALLASGYPAWLLYREQRGKPRALVARAGGQ